MVFFTCDGCGESLKKNQVEKHRFKCRRSQALSCMDCNQIFRDEEFKSHTKCITEEQKYAAKGYVAKQNKGEMKQQAWVENVRLAIQNSNPENKRLQEVLKRLEEYPNIPRKQAKFVNFLGNSINVRDKKLASDVWIAISTAAKTIEERKLAEIAKNTPKATENVEESPQNNFPELPNDPILKELSLDGIQRCKQTKNGLGLVVAKWTFFDKRNNNGSLRESCSYFHWWTLRTVFAWQSVLLEPSEKLKQISEEAVSNFAGSEFFSAMDKTFQTLFWLEAGMNFLQFFDHTKAEQAVQKALEISGLNFSLVGALGKRTKFQQRSVAQLKLTVTGTGQGVAEECEFIPKNCALQDNTVLDTVEFEEKIKEEDLTKISSLEQAVILAMAKLRWRMEPKMGGLLQEEIKVYVDKILESPRDPLVQSSALFLRICRCESEKSERRRVERALAQTEQLSKEFESNSEHKGSVYVFAVAQVPIWKVKKLQADLLISLGVVSEALGIYESLQCWEHVIDCYKTLGKLDHAEHIIRDRLNEKEEPEFLCLLGDITSNPTHYQRAWEVSGKRSSRAMASLGRLYIHKNQMEDAFYCLKRSVDIQPIQLKTWFNLDRTPSPKQAETKNRTSNDS